MVGNTISHYKILEILGAGGMGVVYKARDTRLDRFAALKFLPQHLSQSEEEKRRFIREAKAASTLDHNNIGTVYEISETEDGQMFIAMAYYDGESLKAKIEHGQIPFEDVIDIAMQISEGLAKSHAKGIIHRDIKPANILITEDNVIKIVDFGLAKLTGLTMLTREGTTLGTVSYISPEQTQGIEVDHRTDVWALGVVLYEMITGSQPFQADCEQAVIYSIINKNPAPIPSLRPDTPSELVQIVSNAMQKDRIDRYQNVTELLGDLKACKKQRESGRRLIIKSTGRSPVSRTARRARSVFSKLKSWKTAGAAAFIVLAVFILSYIVNHNIFSERIGFRGIPQQKHIAVLPFTNIGNDSLNQAISEGVVEILTSKLSQLEQFQGELWVVPASEVRKSEVTSASEAMGVFGVNLVLTGSVQRFQKMTPEASKPDSLGRTESDTRNLRISLNLVDAKRQRQLGSKTFDDYFTDVSMLQDEIVIKVAEMLNIELQPKAVQVLTAGNTMIPGANEFYIQGRGVLMRYDKVKNIHAAIGFFTRALQEDANYALAYAGLGEAYLRLYQTTKDVKWVDSAVKNCERAVALDELLAPVRVTLGMIYNETGRYQEALTIFQKALELDPSNADCYRGRAKALMGLGQLEDAESIYKKAIELKPAYWGGYSLSLIHI